MERNVEVVKDLLGNKVVVIQDIRFKGKRAVRWSDVEKYLKQYVGEAHLIKSTNDLVYIGADLPDEYTHSNYTHILKGANAKAKANAAQGLPELLMIATEKEYEINRKEKHSQDAQKGWYYYHTRFALPLYNNKNKTEEYNVYTACLVINCASNGKLYLYDIVDIKKEASNPLKTENSQVVQNRFF